MLPSWRRKSRLDVREGVVENGRSVGVAHGREVLVGLVPRREVRNGDQ